MSPEITSMANPRMRHLVELRDRQARDRDGLFVIEGPRLIGRALAAGMTPVALYWDGTSPTPPTVEPVRVDPDVLDRVSYRKRSEGLIAVFPQWPMTLDGLEPGPEPTFLVLESIEKPGNLGAVLRTADAAGIDAVVMVGRPVDAFNPNVARASTGALFTVPLASATHHELSDWLKGRKVPLVAASPDADHSIWDSDLLAPIAFLIGAEDTGLSPEGIRISDTLVSIPMRGSVDSLNASVTAALLIFESARQSSAR